MVTPTVDRDAAYEMTGLEMAGQMGGMHRVMNGHFLA